MHIIDISLRFARAIFSDRIYRGKILPQINRHIIIIRTIDRKKNLTCSEGILVKKVEINTICCF